MARAGVCPDNPFDCQYTPRELFWMAEAKAADAWTMTGMISMNAFNSNGFLKKHAELKDFIPARYRAKKRSNSSGFGKLIGLQSIKRFCSNIKGN